MTRDAARCTAELAIERQARNTTAGWTLAIALQLGRVSNLPTVWSNTLAAVLIAGGAVALSQLIALLFAMSLAYIGGMFLNDAFDREIDARERPERPVPAGLVPARDVFIAGFLLLALCVILVFIGTLGTGRTSAATGSSVILVASIILYNAWHKGNVLSPVIMGLCRLMVYVSCALSVTHDPAPLLFAGAAATFCYLIGLTYTAKQERLHHISTFWPLLFLAAPVMLGSYIIIAYSANSMLVVMCSTAILSVWTLFCLKLIRRRQPGDVPRAVVSLIAGISLIDALLIAIAMNLTGAMPASTVIAMGVCMAAFVLTLIMQRYVAGT